MKEWMVDLLLGIIVLLIVFAVIFAFTDAGAQVEQRQIENGEENIYICENCHSITFDDDKFCKECGHKLINYKRETGE